MNYIQNDKGEWVIAIGAPASIARAAIQYPLLIETIDEMYAQGAWREEAVNFIKEQPVNLNSKQTITSQYEIESILYHTMYKGLTV